MIYCILKHGKIIKVVLFLIDLLIHPLPNLPLRRRKAQAIRDNATSLGLGYSKSQRISKLHHWFKSYGDFARLVDFAY